MITRRNLLQAAAAWPLVHAVEPLLPKAEMPAGLDNPYSEVDWNRVEFLHSMSHQHQGQSRESLQRFVDMGYQHLAFSNYYPSAPTPLPADFTRDYPDAIECPNGEHHSFTDTGLHGNGLGSNFVSGGAISIKADLSVSPVRASVDNLVSTGAGPRHLAVHWIAVQFSPIDPDSKPEVTIRIEGARQINSSTLQPLDPSQTAPIILQTLAAAKAIYFVVERPKIDIEIQFDPSLVKIGDVTLIMRQGCHQSWRQAFRSILDGQMVDGFRVGGLQFPEGGGITLNHPTFPAKDYMEMLDFDPRVLGIEVWNELTTGFGFKGTFYTPTPGPHTYFYDMWDEILRTGRRCLGFFVKDHLTERRGRNILLVPPMQSLPMPERQKLALRAYRQGAFFGQVAAIACSETGALISPYDLSRFRFSKIEVKDGQVRASVEGNDQARRPQVQIRFRTGDGLVKLVEGSEGSCPLPSSGYIRVEAFAFPRTHLQGKPLTQADVAKMGVYEISRIHDLIIPEANARRGSEFPVPTADLLFSQPIRILP